MSIYTIYIYMYRGVVKMKPLDYIAHNGTMQKNIMYIGKNRTSITRIHKVSPRSLAGGGGEQFQRIRISYILIRRVRVLIYTKIHSLVRCLCIVTPDNDALDET